MCFLSTSGQSPVLPCGGANILYLYHCSQRLLIVWVVVFLFVFSLKINLSINLSVSI